MPPSSTDPDAPRVRDIMTTPVHAVRMDDSILALKAVFDRERFHHAVVLEATAVVGVVSDRDVLKAVSPFVGKATERSQDAGTLHRRVHQIMSRALVTIGPDETVQAAVKKMLAERVSCLPVLDQNKRLLGIVTLRDIVTRTVGLSGTDEKEPPKEAQDDGMLIIIDGRRCYSPDVSLGRLIRDTEGAYTAKHGADAARPQSLPKLAGAKGKP